MNINFELYRIFYVVATIGNITKASEELKISQPAVTKQIKVLENQLGSELFIRTKRGVILTDNGKEIYNYVKQGMNCFKAAELKISNLKQLEKGIIRIGVSTSLARYFLMDYLDIFHKQYPNISIELSTDPGLLMRKKLKDGSLDILIAKEQITEDNDLEITELGLLHHCFIAGQNYQYLKNKIIDINELNNYSILLPKAPSTSLEVFNKFCQDQKIIFHNKLDIASCSLLEDLVKVGLGIGLATKEFAKEDLSKGKIFEIKLKKELPPTKFALITLKNSIHSFAANELINLITKKKN